MSNQVKNKSTVAHQSDVRTVEIALPASTSTSDQLLRRIATLLFILVAGLLDGIRVLREFDLHYGYPGRISRNPV